MSNRIRPGRRTLYAAMLTGVTMVAGGTYIKRQPYRALTMIAGLSVFMASTHGLQKRGAFRRWEKK